jgi:hypothetical protein
MGIKIDEDLSKAIAQMVRRRFHQALVIEQAMGGTKKPSLVASGLG